MFKRWPVIACGYGTGAYYVLWYVVYFPAWRVWPIALATAGFCGTLTSTLMKCSPRPEWAHGKPAKGRP